MIDFIKNNWAFLLVVCFIIFLVWAVMRASKRSDSEFVDDLDEGDFPLDFDCEDTKHLN